MKLPVEVDHVLQNNLFFLIISFAIFISLVISIQSFPDDYSQIIPNLNPQIVV